MRLASGSGVLGVCGLGSDHKGFLRTENGLLISRMEVGLITGSSVSEIPLVKLVNNLGNEVGFLLLSVVVAGDGREPLSAINTEIFYNPTVTQRINSSKD